MDTEIPLPDGIPLLPFELLQSSSLFEAMLNQQPGDPSCWYQIQSRIRNIEEFDFLGTPVYRMRIQLLQFIEQSVIDVYIARKFFDVRQPRIGREFSGPALGLYIAETLEMPDDFDIAL